MNHSKLQQYWIFKFSSSRLKKANYKVENIDVSQARKNGEIVSIGDSQMLRTIRRIRNGESDSSDLVSSLISQRRFLRSKRSTQESIRKSYDLEKKIESFLFVPDIVALHVDDERHYLSILSNGGFYVNGRRFVRFLCGAGNARRSTVIFIDEEICEQAMLILENGRNENVPLIPAKYNAYFALCSSATWSVSEPIFCVVPDNIVKRKEKVHFVSDGDPDDSIDEVVREFDFNLFDGMGLISPRGARAWAEELGLDYVPSTFVIRGSFLKGMVVVFDFHKFAEDVSGKHVISDIWGDKVNIRDVDVILTESQLKMWMAYDSCSSYVENCHRNDLGWGISRYSPRFDRKYVYSNYQFLQALDIQGDEDIRSLCQDSVDFFDSMIGDANVDKTLLYLLGKRADEMDVDEFDNIGDVVAKAIILNNNMIGDPYIQSHLKKSINRKIRDSYVGTLLLHGNYSTMIGDPYAFCEYVFGNKNPNGLLKRGEHFSSFWKNEGRDIVAACRPPLTWKSEVNILNLVSNNDDVNYWYQYIDTGIVYNIHGVDFMLHADSDLDGDIVMTTDNDIFINRASGGVPVSYAPKKAEKEVITREALGKADILAFRSKIGFITNCSTTMYAMLPMFKEGSREKEEILKRLMLSRKEQGLQIDKAKGLVVRPFPSHWTNWIKKEDDITEYESDWIDLSNSIVVDRRAYFMRYLYPDYNKSYLKFRANYESFCITSYGKTLDEILLNRDNLTEEETVFVEKYDRFQPLLDTPCCTNMVCHHMENSVKEIKVGGSSIFPSGITSLLKNRRIPFDREKFKMLYDVYRKYKAGKRNFACVMDGNGDRVYKTLEQYNKQIRLEAMQISSDISELANLAVAICYETHPSDSKTFVWNVFPEGVLKNIYMNRQRNIFVPVRDDDGDIEYLWQLYSKKKIDVDRSILSDYNDDVILYDDWIAPIGDKNERSS